MKTRRSFANVLLCLLLTLMVTCWFGIGSPMEQALAEGNEPLGLDRDSSIADTTTSTEPQDSEEGFSFWEFIKAAIL